MHQSLNLEDKKDEVVVQNALNRMIIRNDDPQALFFSRVLEVIFRLNLFELKRIEASKKVASELWEDIWIAIGCYSSNRDSEKSSNCLIKVCLTDFEPLVGGLCTKKWIGILIGLLVESCSKINSEGGFKKLYIDLASPEKGDEILFFRLNLANKESVSGSETESGIKTILRVILPGEGEMLMSELKDRLADIDKICVIGDLKYSFTPSFYAQVLSEKRVGSGKLRIPLLNNSSRGTYLTLRIGTLDFDVDVII